LKWALNKKKIGIKMTVEWKQKRQNAADWLFAQFPNAFEGLPPLKVGIFNDIRDFECESKPAGVWIRRALRMHTSRMTYRKHLTAGAKRVDLLGEPAGEVTAEEEEKAIEGIAEQRQYNRENAKRKRAALSKAKNKKPTKDKAIKAKPKVLDEINDRPMKCLNYMTPAFIFNESKT